MPSTTERQLILSKPADWDTWISIIRHQATIQNIWNIVNSELTIKPACKEEPTLPDISTIQNIDLIKQKIAFDAYEFDLQDYKREHKRLTELFDNILNSISANNLTHI